MDQNSHGGDLIKYILIGAGGHARVVSSVIEATRAIVCAVFDPNRTIKDMDGVLNIFEYDKKKEIGALAIIAIGDNKIRARLKDEISHRFGTLVHPSAHVDRLVKLGVGSVVMTGAVINRGARIGEHCIINTGAIIEHDSVLDDFVHIAPSATICGGCKIGSNTLIGANATIIPNIEIGSDVIVGAGAVVISNVPNGTHVVGVPAKIKSKSNY